MGPALLCPGRHAALLISVHSWHQWLCWTLSLVTQTDDDRESVGVGRPKEEQESNSVVQRGLM